jgi:hypothetical protein
MLNNLIVQNEIDNLREKLKSETAEYKQAIEQGKTFEEVKVLFEILKDTMNEIIKAVERYHCEVDKNDLLKINVDIKIT